MTISSRLAVASHILAALAVFRNEHTTSDFLAASVGTNPVVVRRITGMLANAGLVRVHAGVGGAELTRPPGDITLLDAYRAVHVVDEEGLFSLHERPNPACPVGGNIEASLGSVFERAQAALEQELARTTVQDLARDLEERQATRI